MNSHEVEKNVNNIESVSNDTIILQEYDMGFFENYLSDDDEKQLNFDGCKRIRYCSCDCDRCTCILDIK